MQTPSPEIPAYSPGRHESTGRTAGRGPAIPEPGTGLLKAMSPGVVDFLFRQLVAGRARRRMSSGSGRASASRPSPRAPSWPAGWPKRTWTP